MMRIRKTMKLSLLASLLLTILLASSCLGKPTKEQYIDQFTAFVDNVTEDAKEYTDADWEKADKQFRKFVEQNSPEYDGLLSPEERKAIGKLEGRYLMLRAKTGLQKAKQGLKELKDQGEGFFEAVKESMKENGLDIDKMME